MQEDLERSGLRYEVESLQHEQLLTAAIQRCYLPLRRQMREPAGPVGGLSLPGLELYGYYAPGNGPCGLHFDWMRLPGGHVVFFFCEAAGRGSATALIAVQAAVLFRSFFRIPSAPRSVIHRRIKDGVISDFLYALNDDLVSKDFSGRFVAAVAGLLDPSSGRVRISSAGLGEVPCFSAREGRLSMLEFPGTPAAGVFPSDLITLQSGFPEREIVLEPGDGLFLVPGKLAESHRYFHIDSRRGAFCTGEDLESRAGFGTHEEGDNGEEFGTARIAAVLQAAMRGERYELRKAHYPVRSEQFILDLAECAGSAAGSVMALLAAEHVFRLFPPSASVHEDTHSVDRVLDEFLRKNFLGYPTYFSAREDSPVEGFNCYGAVRADEAPSLAVMAIQRSVNDGEKKG